VIFKHIFGNAVISKVAHCYLSERGWSSGPPIEDFFRGEALVGLDWNFIGYKLVIFICPAAPGVLY
jgi:hypothetical protein